MTSTNRLAKLFALSLTVVALALPSVASAYPIGAAPGSYHLPPVDSSAPVPAPAPAATVVATESGFDWGDAAIGASVALAVVVIGAGSVLIARVLREDRTRFRLTS